MRALATCHPGKPQAARGLCHNCYDKERSANGDPRRYKSRKGALLKWRFGITFEQYEKMLAQQKGVCAICLRPPKTKKLAVDHDHKTGRVRGLLCWWCNNRIVTSRVKSDDLRRAADYLESTFDGRAL